VDLSTTYLGFNLPHPFISGACPLAENLDDIKRLEDAGAAAIVLHSLFEEQIEREAFCVLNELDPPATGFAGVLSSFPKEHEFAFGPNDYLEHIQRVKECVRIPVIASLNGTRPDAWLKYAGLIEDAGADALELNMYYLPTDPEETGERAEERVLDSVLIVKSVIQIPLAVKLSPFYSALPNLASRITSLGAEGLVLFNRFYQPELGPDHLDMAPSVHLSNSSELPLRLRWIAILSGRIRASLAVTGGVHTADDAGRSIAAGAHAVQMVSALLQNGPEYLTVVRKGLEEWMERHHFDSVARMRGCLNLEHCPDPSAYERGNYARILKSWDKAPARIS